MDAFYALADQRRRRILELLAASGQLSATEISRKFSITAQAISQHLRVLREAKLVSVEKRAQQRIYRVDAQQILEVEEWARQTAARWNESFDALDKVLQEEKRRNAKNK